MNLYEISTALRKVLDDGFAVDEETGEILFDETQLDELAEAREQKLLGIAKVVKGLNAESAAIRQEEIRLADRRKAVENKASRLQDYALAHMTEGEHIKDSQAEIKWQKGRPSVEIVDENAVPNEYMRAKYSPDKTLIGKALKDGYAVAGAWLVTRNKVAIK